MCFSPEMDLAAGTAVVAIGVDACMHIGGRRDKLLLGALPVLLGAHQLIETFVWWGLQGHVSSAVGTVALWLYMLIAFVVLPTFVPIAVIALEPTWERRRRLIPFVVLGAAVSILLLVAMLRGPIGVSLQPWHLAYSIDVPGGTLVVAGYVLATCGPVVLSGYRHLVVFGAANVVAVGVLATLTLDGFASLWCVYAAIAAGAIALHMRYAKPHRTAPYALT